MSTIKIYPPRQLPNEGVSEVAFEIWKEELEIYLDIDDRFIKFLPKGKYDKWEPAETYADRIKQLKPEDVAAQVDITTVRRELRQFLTIIAKLIHEDYYHPIIRHSTSLDWIYTRLRQDLNIQQKGIHFMNIIDMKFDITEQTTPIGFYNNYRSLIMGNLGKKGDKILWQDSTLAQDEKLSPSHEDLILLNVLFLLHPRLPAFIKEHYSDKIGNQKRLMDYKTEILNKAKMYIEEIQSTETQANFIETTNAEVGEETDPQCNYMNTRRPQQRFRYQRTPFRNNQRRFQQTKPSTSNYQPNLPPFCRLCQLSNQPKTIYTNHYLGDNNCPTISEKDKNQLIERASAKFNHLQLEEPDIETEYGYDPLPNQQIEHEQVDIISNNICNKKMPHTNEESVNFSKDTTCSYIKPVPAQVLTLQDSNGNNIHVDLDTGATCSYVKYDAVKRHNFIMKPNVQQSNLADGVTKMSALGEIEETFYRNDWNVKFKAIVVKDLHTDFIGGNNFFKDNNILQDINNKTITVHKKYTVPETNKLLILPTAAPNMILKNNHINIVLPGNSVQYPVPHPENEVLAVQPCFQNKDDIWPPPQICKVSNGFISVQNITNDILSLKNGKDKIQARTVNDFNANEPKCFAAYPPLPLPNEDKYKNVQINSSNIEKNAIDFILHTNEKYKEVFNEDLNNGYNMNFGKHVCSLNWANDTRPQANKISNINYDHDTKVLLQQVCDEFTSAGVLGVPQEFGIQVQHVSPAFLVRKQRAKNKPKNELTTKDVRLVVNFGKINDHLINIPTPVMKPRDIFMHLGRWKHVIVLDLYQGFFQNHMSLKDGKWLGISTPFGGLRFMRRSGQGLLGQSEEMDELLAKVLPVEMAAGFCTRIADDLYIGGSTPMETAHNYEQVISKLHAANLKVSADKTKVFLDSVDILGWVWQKGGFLAPSPHRMNSLKNTSFNDIATIKDMRSWLGLYKTLMQASPNLTLILDPFDKVIADRDSKDAVNWTETLKMQFTKAKEAIDSIQTLYLPDPNDQLLLVVDAAKINPGLGHTLYAIKDNRKLPVAFHSTKLSDNHSKWHSCELEALAFSVAIQSEYHILKECKKPVIIAPDSKAVADAVNLIKKGHHSSNPRIQALITNVNRIPFIVQLANGKNKLNICGDYQSRHTAKCEVQYCAICNFVQEASDSILNPHAINATRNEDLPHILESRTAWKQIQLNSKSCQQTISNLTSGKTPSKMSGKLYSEIRRLTAIADISNDGLLVVKNKTPFSNKNQELIVIPSSHLPAVLWQMHNVHNHPSKSQLKNQFDKSFYSVGLNPELEKLYLECHFCVTQMKIPNLVPHYTINDATTPGTFFHADVIKRRTQNILTIRDNFSSFTVAKIIRSETHKDLKDGIVDLLTPIKLSGTITVKVDNCPGFKPLLDDKDPDLVKIGITIIPTDCFNINENSVVDRACYELEQELVRLEPDGRQVTNTTIQIAVQNLNKKLRRNGKISAFDIFFNRDGTTGEKLDLDYDKLKKDQIDNRNLHNQRHNSKIKTPTETKPQPIPGDIVIPITQKHDKHKARDMFFVTSSEDNTVKMQKIIHSHSTGSNIRQKVYTTASHRVQITRQTNVPTKLKKSSSTTKWSPYQNHTDSSDEENYQLPPISLSSQTSKPSVNNMVPNTQDTSSLNRPQLYQQLDNWISIQRQQAAHQLVQVNQQENITSPSIQLVQLNQQENITSPSFQTPPTTPNDKRAQIKENAKKKISALYKKSIPQLDGCLTDSSAPSSAVPTPEQSPESLKSSNINTEPKQSSKTSKQNSTISRKQKKLAPARCEIEHEAAITFDYAWDHEADIHAVPTFFANPDDIFEEPDPVLDFLQRHASI